MNIIQLTWKEPYNRDIIAAMCHLAVSRGYGDPGDIYRFLELDVLRDAISQARKIAPEDVFDLNECDFSQLRNCHEVIPEDGNPSLWTIEGSLVVLVREKALLEGGYIVGDRVPATPVPISRSQNKPLSL